MPRPVVCCSRFDDYHDFAAATAGLSGVDIQKIARNARRSARRRREPITRTDVLLHLPFMADIPPRVLRASAVHDIGHAVVGAVLGMDLVKVAIVGRIRIDEKLQTLGHARFRRDSWIRRTKQHYLDLIAMSLAGMAAEQVFLGGHNDGAAGNEGIRSFRSNEDGDGAREILRDGNETCVVQRPQPPQGQRQLGSDASAAGRWNSAGAV